MLKEDGGGGVEEGCSVTCMETSGVMCVAQVCNTKWNSGFHTFKGCSSTYSTVYIKQTISSALPITKKRTSKVTNQICRTK